MKDRSGYKIGFFVMLLMNGVMLFFLFQRPKPHPPGGGPSVQGHATFQRIKDLLQLDDRQVEAFEELAMDHRRTLRRIEDEQGEVLQAYFSYLKMDQVPAQQGEELQEFLQLEQEKIEYTFQHFQELKALCRPDQLTEIETLTEEILQVLGPQEKNPPPRPREPF
ncbi:MAG: hypothetical protein AAFQ98_18230 [Bacteroidota bacterium]